MTSSCFGQHYEVRDLFPWEMLTKMLKSYLPYVIKKLKSTHIDLSSTLNFYRKYCFDATQSTQKSTSEIDADLAQNEMKLYLNPSRQLNPSLTKEYTCHSRDLSSDTQITHLFNNHQHFSETVILSNFYKIHDEKYSFLPFSTGQCSCCINIKKISWRHGIRC